MSVSVTAPLPTTAADDAELERVGRLEELYPELAPLLATPADFRVYRKPLTVG